MSTPDQPDELDPLTKKFLETITEQYRLGQRKVTSGEDAEKEFEKILQEIVKAKREIERRFPELKK